MKSVEHVIQTVFGLIVGIPLLIALSEEVGKAAADCTEPTRALVLLLVDPTEYVWKWVLIAFGVIAYGAQRLSCS